MKKLLIIAAIAAAQPALAQGYDRPASGGATVTVSARGLDLASTEGVKALDRRVLHAASLLCGTPSPADPHGRVNYDKCRDEVRAQAVTARDRAVSLARAQNGAIVVAGR